MLASGEMGTTGRRIHFIVLLEENLAIPAKIKCTYIDLEALPLEICLQMNSHGNRKIYSQIGYFCVV